MRGGSRGNRSVVVLRRFAVFCGGLVSAMQEVAVKILMAAMASPPLVVYLVGVVKFQGF